MVGIMMMLIDWEPLGKVEYGCAGHTEPQGGRPWSTVRAGSWSESFAARCKHVHQTHLCSAKRTVSRAHLRKSWGEGAQYKFGIEILERLKGCSCRIMEL